MYEVSLRSECCVQRIAKIIRTDGRRRQRVTYRRQKSTCHQNSPLPLFFLQPRQPPFNTNNQSRSLSVLTSLTFALSLSFCTHLFSLFSDAAVVALPPWSWGCFSLDGWTSKEQRRGRKPHSLYLCQSRLSFGLPTPVFVCYLV